MSSLTAIEKRQFEKLFGMSGGYVLNFSNSTFGDFFLDEVGVEIHSEKYYAAGSKANKLREFWRSEGDTLVGRALLALIDHWTAWADPDSPDHALAEDCRVVARRLVAGRANVAPLKAAAKAFDSAYLANQLRRMEESIDQDPELAIGTAKETVETCCKTILVERGRSPSPNADVPTLTKETLKELRLVPESVADAARDSDVVKRLLSNLGTIGNALAELRGLYGTGHGKHGRTAGLRPRHARLAVGAAATLCTFLFETHKETSDAR